MASEGFITESQRHLGINGAFVGNDDLCLTLRFAFHDMREAELNLLSLDGNQDGEVFDILGRLQEQRSAHLLLHQRTRRLQQASPWRDGIARKMRLVDWMLGIAPHKNFKAIVDVRHGLSDEKVIQEIHFQCFYSLKTLSFIASFSLTSSNRISVLSPLGSMNSTWSMT